MNIEAFIHWALQEQRTLEERFTVECLVETGLGQWHRKRKNYQYQNVDSMVQKQREQTLNPAYLPDYSEETLRMAAEEMPAWSSWDCLSRRPIRDISALSFFPHLQALNLGLNSDIPDLTPLGTLSKLRKLTIGYAGSLHGSDTCEDYTPLCRCTALQELTLSFGFSWPDFTGFEALENLEILHLTGNLQALPRDLTLPRVRTAGLHCKPLALRDVRDMPNLPACEFLTLSGADSLRGIEKMPCLRNLTLVGAFKSYEPLTALQHLTCLQVDPVDSNNKMEHPVDLTPINRIPGLLHYQYGRAFAGFDMPHDYSQLTDSPTLREILVQGCPDVEMEVASINAGLPSWGDLLLVDPPKSLPRNFRFVIAPMQAFEGDPGPEDQPGDPMLTDHGLIKCAARWIAREGSRVISETFGHSDWGRVECREKNISINIESYEVVERLPQILDAARAFTARLRHRYSALLWIMLRIPPPEPSPALEELTRELQKRREQWDQDNHEHEGQKYLRDLHRLQLKEQEGSIIDPDEFSPDEPPPYPQMEDLLLEKEEQPDDENDDEEGFVAVQTEFKQNTFFEDDDAHPLADSYNLIATLYWDAIRFNPHNRDIAIYLMARSPDLDLSDPGEDAE